jgi:hypothetical protein
MSEKRDPERVVREIKRKTRRRFSPSVPLYVPHSGWSPCVGGCS